MYLLINDTKYTVTKRIKTKDTVKYLGVSPSIENIDGISGIAKMYTNEDFFMSEDSLDDYKYKTFTGTLLVLTNKEKELPEDQTKTPNYRLTMLEKENTDLTQRLAETDEIAIDLYEASLANEAINAEQDEAIIEIYETMEGLING